MPLKNKNKNISFIKALKKLNFGYKYFKTRLFLFILLKNPKGFKNTHYLFIL